MRPSRAGWLLATTALVAVVSAQTPVPSAPVPSVIALGADQPTALRDWDERLDRMQRSGEVVLRGVRADTVLSDRTHERYDQYVRGVRVFGGDLARQIRGGLAESIYGTVYDDIAIDTVPRLSEDDARAVFAAMSIREFPSDRPIELVILPKDEGGYALAWRTHVWTDEGWMHTWLDASSGQIVLQYNDLQSQAAVGTGTGVLGDRKKVSVRQVGGQYVADDQLRPPQLVTYDMHGNRFRADLYLDGYYRPGLSDLASDSDNAWTDVANVDAHTNLGWTYDYYYKRLGRRGLDDHDAPILALTHPVHREDVPSLPRSASDYAINAFWCGGCGPDRRGVMVFGEGLPAGYVLTSSGQYVDYLAGALDVIAHELTHGLTDYSSNLIYRNESGALNESFSDILGASTEFFFQQTGPALGQADYLIGEDVFRPGGIRSMSNPGTFGDPGHYLHMYRGSQDHGGVHTNSGIPNHAFYLAIEGGVNRTSGLAVQGVGAANREQIEKSFYRAFVYKLTSNATFAMARRATIEAAREQYGAGSPAERAITQAWTAVGVF